MKDEFLVIHKDALPAYFSRVVEAVNQVRNYGKNISEVCKELDISRSTFYKYKDKVFDFNVDYGKKAILSFKVNDTMGVLSNILNKIADFNGNVLTINQDMPIHKVAYITIAIDSGDLTISVYDLLRELKKIPNVINGSLLAFE